MSGNRASPFGFDTLTLDAVIVRDGTDDPSSRALATTLGAEHLTLHAVLTPPNGTPPPGDWLNLGLVALPKQPGQAASGASGGAPPRAPDDQTPERGAPRTRFYHPHAATPAPNAGPDPVIAATARWQRMNVPVRRTKRRLPVAD